MHDIMSFTFQDLSEAESVSAGSRAAHKSDQISGGGKLQLVEVQTAVLVHDA